MAKIDKAALDHIAELSDFSFGFLAFFCYFFRLGVLNRLFLFSRYDKSVLNGTDKAFKGHFGGKGIKRLKYQLRHCVGAGHAFTEHYADAVSAR